ncbi:hypothetical protein ACPZ19_48735 [Amycolatopsis lurida]
MDDKWARRRAARRNLARPSARPRCIRISWALWLGHGIIWLLLGLAYLVAGSPTGGGALVLGVFSLLGAVNLRDGFHGPRYVLTGLGIIGLTLLLGVDDPAATVLPAVVPAIALGGSAVAAAVLMWLPDANRYVRQTRADFQANSNK